MSGFTQAFSKELASLTPSGVVELFVLDASEVGGSVLYFYSGTGVTTQPTLPNPQISFQGQVYHALPIEVKGFEFSAKGELPRPSIVFSNVAGAFTALSLMYEDLIGAKLTRKRTLRKFLDDGSDPDPNAELPPDVYYVDRKVNENKFTVEFELGTILDVEGLTLPKRQVLSNICCWKYRGAECAFAGNYFVCDINGTERPNQSPAPSEWSASNVYYENSVVYVIGADGFKQYFVLLIGQAAGEACRPPIEGVWLPDRCSKTLAACRKRQDPNNKNLPLTFGAFPGTSLVPEV